MPEYTSTANLADLLEVYAVPMRASGGQNSPPIMREKTNRVPLESMAWPEIVRISFISLVVIGIYVCPLDLVYLRGAVPPAAQALVQRRLP